MNYQIIFFMVLLLFCVFLFLKIIKLEKEISENDKTINALFLVGKELIKYSKEQTKYISELQCIVEESVDLNDLKKEFKKTKKIKKGDFLN